MFLEKNGSLSLQKLMSTCMPMTRLSRVDTDFRIPLLKTFSFRGAKLWNSLERETELAPCLKIFKELLLKGL